MSQGDDKPASVSDMPNICATRCPTLLIGFTGTPIELADENTPAVFGDYIDIYDITQAVRGRRDGADLLREPVGQVELRRGGETEAGREFEEVTEDEEPERAGEAEAPNGPDGGRWSGAEKRMEHDRRRSCRAFREAVSGASDGKAMIVCMSRRICVDLYDADREAAARTGKRRRREGVIKVVMTGTATDPTNWQPHIHEGAAGTSGQAHARIRTIRSSWSSCGTCG